MKYSSNVPITVIWLTQSCDSVATTKGAAYAKQGSCIVGCSRRKSIRMRRMICASNHDCHRTTTRHISRARRSIRWIIKLEIDQQITLVLHLSSLTDHFRKESTLSNNGYAWFLSLLQNTFPHPLEVSLEVTNRLFAQANNNLDHSSISNAILCRDEVIYEKSLFIWKRKTSNRWRKLEEIYLLITFNPFRIALCNGELFSSCIGENSNWIVDERFTMDERCSWVSS